MPMNAQRGYTPGDRQEFSDEVLPVLQGAQADIRYLLDRGYGHTHAVTFVGDRFQLSARQRMALTRATVSTEALELRRRRRMVGELAGRTVFLDGFNLIITLEAALTEGTTLLRCMDGAVRDLCGLHGGYRMIAGTVNALEWSARALLERGAADAVFFLDAPVSHSGSLRGRILEVVPALGLPCEVHLVPNADAELWGRECVVTSDGNILERCGSWVNLAAEMLAADLPGRRLVELCCSFTE